MKSPIKHFLSWYSQLPLLHQQAIGWMTSLYHTDFEGAKQANREAIPMLFRSILNGYERESEHLRASGALSAIAAHVESFFIKERGYQDVLDEIQDILRQSHLEELTETAERLLSKD
ncbi:MAG: hypothetical protein Q8O23_00915, partial [Gallionella sp.]|nr:hypothetical protein [Gallionella sp.]